MMKGEYKSAHFRDVEVKELGMSRKNAEEMNLNNKNVRMFDNKLPIRILAPI